MTATNACRRARSRVRFGLDDEASYPLGQAEELVAGRVDDVARRVLLEVYLARGDVEGALRVAVNVEGARDQVDALLAIAAKAQEGGSI